MADRMRVTSLIGGTDKIENPAEILRLDPGTGPESLTGVRVEPDESPGSFPFPRRQSLSIPAAWPECLDFFDTPLVIEPSPGPGTRNTALVSPRVRTAARPLA